MPWRQNIYKYFEKEVKPYAADLPAPPVCHGTGRRPVQGQFCVYVLKCKDNSFYIGQTENFPKRLHEHEAKTVDWTAPRLPIELIHWEIFVTREEAVKREQDLKTGFGRKWLKREYEKGRLASASRQAGAWIDETVRDTKDGKIGIVGYEIPFSRYFYKYEAPRKVEEIEGEIKETEQQIVGLIKKIEST